MIWAIAVVAAAAGPTCYRDKSTGVNIMRCALCPNTAGVLAGENTVWYTGGYNGTGVSGSARMCSSSDEHVGRVVVLAGATIVKGVRSVKITSVEIQGGGVNIHGVHVIDSVTITGPVATKITLTDVLVDHPLVGVRVFNPNPLAPTMDVSNLNIARVAPTAPANGSHWATAALAHTKGSPISITCSSKSHIVVTQPDGAQPAIVAGVCDRVVDLSDMLNVFGTRYEILFDHWDYIPEAGGYAFWVWRLIAINVALALMIAMCATADAPVAKEKQS